LFLLRLEEARINSGSLLASFTRISAQVLLAAALRRFFVRAWSAFALMQGALFWTFLHHSLRRRIAAFSLR
jgi:hypothetical protein